VILHCSILHLFTREALKAEGEARRSELERKSKELANSFNEDTNRLKQIIKKGTAIFIEY
jgi:uncharacterized tellurite resistance protein B-like protein